MNKLILFFVFLISPVIISAFDRCVTNEMIQRLNQYVHNEKGWTPLNYAIEEQDYGTAIFICDLMEDILAYDEGLDAISRLFRNECRKTDIQIPLENRYKMDDLGLQLANKLLRRGVNLHYVPEANGQVQHHLCPILQYSCFLGLEDFTVALLDKKVDVNQRGGLGTAIRAGHINVVHLLIDRGVDVNNGALNAAVYAKKYEIIDLLLSSGADINKSDLLMIAISPGVKFGLYLDGLPMLKFLLER
jgi:hypothetical protein